MYAFVALVSLVTTSAIIAFGVRLLSIINNIGVATEILGMFVFALILLFFANHQSPSVLFDTAGAEKATGGSYLPAFLLGMFMALFVVYGFDTAGTFGEETLDASRQAPRGVLSAIWLSGIPQYLPLSVTATLHGAYNAHPQDNDKFDLATRAVVLQAGGAFRDKAGDFGLSLSAKSVLTISCLMPTGNSNGRRFAPS